MCADDLPGSKGHAFLHARIRGQPAEQMNKDVGAHGPYRKEVLVPRAGRTAAPVSPHPLVAAEREQVGASRSSGPEEEAGAERVLRGGQEACEVFPAPLMLAPGGLRTPFLHLSNPVLFPVLQTPNSSCLTTSRPLREIAGKCTTHVPVRSWRGAAPGQPW